MHERKLGVHLLQARVLGLELFEPPQVARGEAAVLGLPVVEGRLADAEFAAEVAGLLAALLALERGDDLRFAESGLSHRSKVGVFSTFDRASFQGS